MISWLPEIHLRPERPLRYHRTDNAESTNTLNGDGTITSDWSEGWSETWDPQGGSGSGSGSSSGSSSSGSYSGSETSEDPVDNSFAENRQTEPAPVTGNGVMLNAAAILEMLGRPGADAVREAGTNPETPEETEEPIHEGGPLEGGGRWEYWQSGTYWWYGEFDEAENLVYEATGDMANQTVTQIIYEAQQEVATAEGTTENGTGIADEANGVGNEEDGKQINYREALAELPDEALNQMIRDKLPGAYADEVVKQASREQKIKLLWKLNQGWKITYRDSEDSDEDYEVVGNVIRIQTQKYRSFSEYGVHGPSSRRTWRHIGSKSNEEIAAALLSSLDDKYVQNAGGYRGGTLENPAEVGWNDFVENPRTKGAVAFVRVVGGVATIVTSGGATLPLVIGTYETFRGTDDGVKIVAEEITGEEYRGVAESGLDAFTEDEETSNKILFWLDSGVMIVELGNGVRMAFRKAKPGKSLADDALPGSAIDDATTLGATDAYKVLPSESGKIVKLKRRMTDQEMITLQKDTGVEWAQVYVRGPGKDGGGGHYILIRGGEDYVNIPFDLDGTKWVLINHTHPADALKMASNRDRIVFRHLRNAQAKYGYKPQSFSYILTEDGVKIRFNAAPPIE